MNKKTSKPKVIETINKATSPAPVQRRVDTQWFKDRIADQLLSLRRLAEKMGMEPSALSLTINGKRQLTADEAGLLAGHLRVSVDDVLRHAGVVVRLDSAVAVPVVAWADAQGIVRTAGLMGPKMVASPSGTSEGLKAIRSQTGGIQDGWVFFYKDAAGIPPDAVGRLCLVNIEGEDETKLRFVSRGYETGVWALTAMDGTTREAKRLLGASPVLWVKQG